MRVYGQAGRPVGARGYATLPLQARPTGRTPLSDLARNGSHRPPTVPVPTGPEPRPTPRPRKPLTPKPAPRDRPQAQHGTLTMYSTPNSCRCDPCRAAKRDYDQGRRRVGTARWDEAGVHPALVRAWAAASGIPVRSPRRRPALPVLEAFLRARDEWATQQTQKAGA